ETAHLQKRSISSGGGVGISDSSPLHPVQLCAAADRVTRLCNSRVLDLRCSICVVPSSASNACTATAAFRTPASRLSRNQTYASALLTVVPVPSRSANASLY